MVIAYSNFEVCFKKQFGERNIMLLLRKFLKHFFKYNNAELIVLSNIRNKGDLGYAVTITTRQVPSLKIHAAFMKFCKENGYLKKNKVATISKIKHKLTTKKHFKYPLNLYD